MSCVAIVVRTRDVIMCVMCVVCEFVMLRCVVESVRVCLETARRRNTLYGPPRPRRAAGAARGGPAAGADCGAPATTPGARVDVL